MKDEDKVYFVAKKNNKLHRSHSGAKEMISALPGHHTALLNLRSIFQGLQHRVRFDTANKRLPCTSLQQAGPSFQAAVPALAAELVLALHDPKADGIPQGLCQARLPPAKPLLLAGQLQQVALLHVDLPLGRVGGGSQGWEVGQGFFPGQAERKWKKQ